MRLLSLILVSLTLAVTTGCDEVRIKLGDGQVAAVSSDVPTVRLTGVRIGDDGIDVPGVIQIDDDGIDVPGMVRIDDDGIELEGTVEVVGDEVRIRRAQPQPEAR
jgi:hypothetical protein